MKKLFCFLVMALALPITLAACGGVPICDSDEEPPTHTQEEIEARWEERGIWSATTLEEASEVAGFEVVSPGFIPEDFCRGLYIHVIDPCLWPTEDFDCGLSIQVMQTWAAWVEDESLEFSQRASLSLVQTPSSMGTGDVPTEVGGYPATIDYVGSESDPPFLVTLHWEIDGMYFILSGWIASPLTEELIYEVAASVEVD
ncbi:hypothetical protein ES708_01946 [subsurface metagenome]